MTTTFWSICANAAPSAAVDVVLPTPPLPDVTTITLAILSPPRVLTQAPISSISRLQATLERAARKASFQIINRSIVAVDRQQLGFDPAAEDAHTWAIHDRQGEPSLI
jgi:hypothetical protein